MTDTGKPSGVSLSEIASAKLEKPPLEAAQTTQDPLTGRDFKLDQHLGRVGGFIGGGPEKAGNIAFFVVCASIVILVGLIIALCFVPKGDAETALDRLASGFLALITGSLGYLFGSKKE